MRTTINLPATAIDQIKPDDGECTRTVEPLRVDKEHILSLLRNYGFQIPTFPSCE